MDRYWLKNIIILILLLVNGFLLGAMAMRRTTQRSAQRKTAEQIVALFAASDMELDAEVISTKTPPAAVSLTRDTDREREAAVFFLGKNLLQANQGGIYTYTGENGVALFRSNGSFDIAGSLSSGDAQELCRAFCKEFSYDEPAFTLDGGGTGTGSAACRHGEMPVFNCTVSFSLDQGTLLTVSGTLLPESGGVLDEELLSAAGALLAFQKMYQETPAVATSVTEMYPCYALQSTAASLTSLVPAWCVVTDVARYYVNCITGEVSTG